MGRGGFEATIGGSSLRQLITIIPAMSHLFGVDMAGTQRR